MKFLSLNNLTTLWERIGQVIDCKCPVVWFTAKLDDSEEEHIYNNVTVIPLSEITCDTSFEKVASLIRSGVMPRCFVVLYTGSSPARNVYELFPEYEVDSMTNLDDIRFKRTEIFGDAELRQITINFFNMSGHMLCINLMCDACDEVGPV